MALYLNNLDLNGNQLIKATVHPLGTAPATAQEGQIYYDTGDNVVYVNTSTTPSSPSWKSMGGDITGVSFTTDDSTTISDTSGDAAFTIAGGTGITTSSTGSTVTITVGTLNQNTTGSAGSVANALTVDNTTVKLSSGTTYNGSAALTISAKTASIADGGTALATADQIHTFVTGASTTGNAATVTTNANLTGHITSSGNAAVLGSFTTAQLNAAISDGSINVDQTNVTGSAATVTGAAQTAITSVGTLTGLTVSGNITANGNINGDNATNIGSIDTLTAKEIALNTSGSNTTLKILDVASKSITLGKTNTSGNTDGTSVSVENDLTVKGKLTVQGDLVTTSTSNTVIKDNIIQINDGGNASNHTTTQADMGIVMDRGTDGNVALNWDESDNAFKFIATGDTAASSTMTMTSGGGDNNDENTSGTTAPAGYQTLYAGIIRAVGAVGTAGFYGNGANITGISAANISAGTLAAARGGTGLTSISTLLNSNVTSVSGNAGTATKIASITNSNIVQLAETQTLTNKTLTSPVLNTGVSGTAIKDEDDMTSNSATHLATQQSIKAYVDSQGSSSSNTGGRQAFVLGHATSGVAGNTGSANGNNIFTITHGMGSSRNYGVEVIRNGNNSGGGETVIVDVARPTDTTITITFAAAVTALDYTALVCKY